MSNVLREIGERLKNRKGVLFLVQRKPPAAVGGFLYHKTPKSERISFIPCLSVQAESV